MPTTGDRANDGIKACSAQLIQSNGNIGSGEVASLLGSRLGVRPVSILLAVFDQLAHANEPIGDATLTIVARRLAHSFTGRNTRFVSPATSS